MGRTIDAMTRSWYNIVIYVEQTKEKKKKRTWTHNETASLTQTYVRIYILGLLSVSSSTHKVGTPQKNGFSLKFLILWQPETWLEVITCHLLAAHTFLLNNYEFNSSALKLPK